MRGRQADSTRPSAMRVGQMGHTRGQAREKIAFALLVGPPAPASSRRRRSRSPPHLWSSGGAGRPPRTCRCWRFRPGDTIRADSGCPRRSSYWSRSRCCRPRRWYRQTPPRRSCRSGDRPRQTCCSSCPRRSPVYSAGCPSRRSCSSASLSYSLRSSRL